MLSFFRKIRQSLLNDGKTSRYIKYAIGEIILVVIGILIALQLNNWNQARLSKEFEFKMLSELKTSLTIELKFLEQFENRLTIKDKAIDKILYTINQETTLKKDLQDIETFLMRLKINEETITKILLKIESELTLNYDELMVAISQSNWGILYIPDRGAYESIKSIGLNKIKSDVLRNKLIRFYEVTVLRYTTFIDGTFKDQHPMKNNYLNLLKKDKLIYRDFKYIKYKGFRSIRKINEKKILESDIFQELLLEEAKYKDKYFGLFKNMLRSTKDMLQAVDQELNTRFKDV